MQTFRTIINTGPPRQSLSLKSTLITAGSCFADAMGHRLQEYKIPVLANPFGNIYNPYSIHKVLHYAISKEMPSESTYLENHGIHLNYDFHSEFSSLGKPELTEKIQETISSAHTFIKGAAFLIITYGTAWVYESIADEEIVANCHKMPSHTFKKYLFTQKKIIESFEGLYNALKALNSNLRIVLTVSPVRHQKDTLELNSVSKSVLRVACHTLTETFPDVDYFPAYEIMMDDLRDYRFYKADMLHPSEQAEEYIWEKFTERYADKATEEFIKKWKSLRSALAHKPFHPSSYEHQKFLKKLLTTLEELKSSVNVEEEITHLKARITP